MGVCRVAESEGRPIDFGDLIPSDSVLRRLSEDLFTLVFLALSTWRVVKDSMVFEGGSWSSIRSEDLLEGLSNRGEDSRSQEETPRSLARRELLALTTLGSRGLICLR